jgi:outer membrane protein TolC
MKSAKAEFYPSLKLDGTLRWQTFSGNYLFKTPESLLWAIVGEFITQLVNRNALKANYFSAIAEQNKTAYMYEQRVINAYSEVANQQSNIINLENAYNLKKQQVEALTQSVDISINLFKNARADYMEVLLTQRDALEAKYELI